MPHKGQRQPNGILTSSEPASALGDWSRTTGVNGTRVTSSPIGRNDPQKNLSEASVATSVASTARKQFVRRDVTITELLNASAARSRGVPVALFNTNELKKKVRRAATTDASGQYEFSLTDSSGTTSRTPFASTAIARKAVQRAPKCS
jgi:hypothetical protein